jgi:hypothetical protein
MDRFLSDTMRIINLMPDFDSKAADKFFREEQPEKDRPSKKDILIKNRDNLEPIFIRGMIRAREIFDKHTFRRSYDDKRKAPINKSLFELLSVSLAKQSNAEYTALLKKKKTFLSDYSQLLDEENFRNIISKDSLKYNSVQERHKQFTALLKKHSK